MDERRMDNRLGERVAVQLAIRLISSRPRTVIIGRLQNLSRSGALIAECDLQLFSLIHVVLKFPERRRQEEETIAAYVTRVSDEGVGVEWCEFAPPAVAELLQTAMASLDPSSQRQAEALVAQAPRAAAR